jgi:glycosyltransferase involved in cell wall biosynthesis
VTLVKNNVNLGLAASSNIGIQSSTGRYVVRVDSDDYVHPDFLKTLMLGFELFGDNYQAISVDYLQITPEGRFLEYGNSEISPIACGIAFKMDSIEQIGFYNPKLRLNEEVDLRKRFRDEGFLIRNINLPMYKYVKHDQSLTNRPLI